MMTYDELDRRCTRLSQINYGYRKQADAMRVYIVELEEELKWFTNIGNYPTNCDCRYQVYHARTALERKP